jgi:PAS domain-containing protein
MPSLADTQSKIGELEAVTTKLDSAESELRQAYRFLKACIEDAPCGIIVCNRFGEFLVWNDYASTLLDKGPLNVKPEEWPETYHLCEPDDRSKAIDEAPLATALKGNSVSNRILWVANGTGRLIKCNAKPVHCRRGDLIGAVVFFSMIDEETDEP